MKNDLTNLKEKEAVEPIVIPDECGDSMWDAVLDQEINPSLIFEVFPVREKSINGIENMQAGITVVK